MIDFNLCGIDEAGRGPLAGPMVVVGVMLKKEIKGLNDSKKLTQKRREELFQTIKENSYFHIVFSSNEEIDNHGLSFCMKKSINEIMQNIKADEFLLDGNTTYKIKNLKCKVKADSTVAQVSAASILAKVSRDDYMIKVSKKYPNYNFQKHKGYGTKAHIQAIKDFGYCQIHRTSFNIKL